MELNWKETFISASQLALFVQIILGECIGIAFAGRGGTVWIKYVQLSSIWNELPLLHDNEHAS